METNAVSWGGKSINRTEHKDRDEKKRFLHRELSP
jgi:hypothetical protein